MNKTDFLSHKQPQFLDIGRVRGQNLMPLSALLFVCLCVLTRMRDSQRQEGFLCGKAEGLIWCVRVEGGQRNFCLCAYE